MVSPSGGEQERSRESQEVFVVEQEVRGEGREGGDTRKEQGRPPATGPLPQQETSP